MQVRRQPKRLPTRLFDEFKKNLPLCCVDVIIRDRNGQFILVRRKIPPYAGKWGTPGGIIRFGENLTQAVKRISRNETGLTVSAIKRLGFYEHIDRKNKRHDITHGFLGYFDGVYDEKKLKTDQSQNYTIKVFKAVPQDLPKFHLQMFRDAGFPS